MEPRDVFTENLARLSGVLLEHYDIVLIFSPSTITYATGIRAPSGVLALTRECGPLMAVPLLDYTRTLGQAPREIELFVAFRGGEEQIQSDVPERRVIRGGLVDAARHFAEKCGAKKVGADLGHADYRTAKILADKLGAEDASELIENVRAVKTSGEIELIEAAARIAEDAFRSVLEHIGEGASEASLAGLLYKEMLERGAWSEAFPSIVAFYAHTALPHHTPTLLRLAPPGPVLFDWGAVYWGYRSDMTRTFWHGGVAPERFRLHLEAVLEAQGEAADTIAAGVEAWEPDNAARRVLSRRGLDKFFIHGLGHGVGIDIHEKPFLRPGSKTILEKGMVVTVEPGVYIPGIHGIRVEDMYLVTASGARRLTRLSRIIQ